MTTAADGKTIRVALAGSPNTGKSTVFNFLTGLSQHVGNWPGKTVERKTGTCQRDGITFSFVDLPGSYSLTASSLEEEIARDYVIEERPDVVVVVVDASCLERNLYLVCEFLELGVPLVVALNMMDVAQSHGFEVDARALEEALGAPVIPMVATRGEGVSELLEAVQAVAAEGITRLPPAPLTTSAMEALIATLDGMLPADPPLPYPRRWAVVKLLEGDRAIAGAVKQALSASGWRGVDSFLHLHEDAVLEIAGARYQWVAETSQRAVRRLKRERVPLGERADHILTHPIGGLLTFLGLVAAIFWAVFSLGLAAQGWLDDNLVGRGAEQVEASLEAAPAWLVSLLADGVIGGVGTVLTFLPIIAILVFALSLLEDVGYMARAAFIMDRFMRPVGLRGKSFLPLSLGFACNVPAIVGSRIVEPPSARLTTILVAPLVPCTARMVVVALFTAAFFGGAAALVSWSMVGINLMLLAVAGLLLSRLLHQGEETAFVMELPHYHTPNWRTVLMATWQRVRGFVVRAGTAILLLSVLVWGFSTFPSEEIENSVMGFIGRGLEPIGGVMGFDWRMMAALPTSFIAKEQAIATLGVMLGTGGEEAALRAQLSEIMVPAAALAFIAVQMLFVPCVASMAVIRHETGSWRWTGLAMAYTLAISFSVGIAIYQAARLIGLGV